jgi:RNA polymerase sigma factor (sigma-70 family)
MPRSRPAAKIAPERQHPRPYEVTAPAPAGTVIGRAMDTELVIRAKRGDETAFASLAGLVGDRLHAVSHRILRDTDLAEDATQQALVSIWRDLPTLKDPERFDAWSYRLLVRACYAEGRRNRRWAPNLSLLPTDRPEQIDRLGSVVDRDELERGFRRLSLDHRTVVVLHHYLDLPIDAVAEIVGISVGTVRSRLRHAMRGLRAALDADARPATQEALR